MSFNHHYIALVFLTILSTVSCVPSTLDESFSANKLTWIDDWSEDGVRHALIDWPIVMSSRSFAYTDKNNQRIEFRRARQDGYAEWQCAPGETNSARVSKERCNKCYFYSNFENKYARYFLESRAEEHKPPWWDTKANGLDDLNRFFAGCLKTSTAKACSSMSTRQSDQTVCCALREAVGVVADRYSRLNQCRDHDNQGDEESHHTCEKKAIDSISVTKYYSSFIIANQYLKGSKKEKRKPKIYFQNGNALPSNCKYAVDPGVSDYIERELYSSSNEINRNFLNKLAREDKTFIECDVSLRDSLVTELNPVYACDNIAQNLRVGFDISIHTENKLK